MQHTGSSLRVTWTCTLDQDHSDEWFGINKITITTYSCYDAQCWRCDSPDQGAPCRECRPGYTLVGTECIGILVY